MTKSLKDTMIEISNMEQFKGKPLCFMLIGPPASGKSTIAQKIQETFPQCNKYDTDDIVHDRAKKLGISYAEVIRNSELRNGCVAQYNMSINDYLKNRESFIWEQLNTQASARQIKIKRVRLTNSTNRAEFGDNADYVLIGIYTEIPYPINVERLIARNQQFRYTPEDKFISPRVLDNILKEYEIPKETEAFHLLFKADENLNLTSMPSNVITEEIKALKSSNKPSDEEIERRRKIKHDLRSKLSSS